MSTTSSFRPLLAKVTFVGLLALSWGLDQRDESELLPEGNESFRMREVHAEVGIDFRHVRPSFDPKLANIDAQIAALGAAVSVADADGDGRPDLYATNSAFGEPNALYVNRGEDGARRLVDMAAEAGVADLNVEGRGVSMGSVWADMDNDGDEDLFVYRYGYPALFRNEGGLRFTEVTAGSGLERWMNANAAVWFDADQDGLVDLFVAGYFHERYDLWDLETTEIMQESFEFATNGGSNVLFRNLGDGRFEDVTERAGLSSSRWTMGAAAADFDGDGLVDLYTANDYGAEEFYRNRGGGRFELYDAGLGDDSKSGMCVALGELLNEARLSVFVTNISVRGYLFQGNNLRHSYLAEGAGFQNVASGKVADCGWAWGSQIGDLDNDGWQDLFVANGFVTGDEGAGDYWYNMTKVGGAASEVVVDAANWPTMGGMDLSGNERSRVLLNRNGRIFTDVAEAAGVTDTYDGRSVVLVDLFDRGALDVVVANQRGPLLVYSCEPPAGRHWVKVSLEGSAGPTPSPGADPQLRRSNRSGIGATVEVKAGDVHTVRVVDGGSGFCSQNERRLHFGLGDEERLEEVVVHWPSGRKTVLRDLPVDTTHHVTEDAP